jgi:hypothetical protein
MIVGGSEVVMTWMRARSVRVGMALVALSSAYWCAVWAWTEAESVRETQAGAHPLAMTLHANGFVLEATYAYVVGVIALHVGLLGLTTWRSDASGRRGVGVSFGLHFLFLVLSGIVAPPSASVR